MSVDLAPWLDAPRERTPDYFPVYSAVSKAMQRTLRAWVAGWFAEHHEILAHPQRAYPVLIYQATVAYTRSTNVFGYDVRDTQALDRAFRSATFQLRRQLEHLDTKSFDWSTREKYFAYRSQELVKLTAQHRNGIYRMLQTDVALMDVLLKFSIVEIPKLGLERASERIRSSFRVKLGRLSKEFEFSDRSEELLGIATDALKARMPFEDAVGIVLAA